MLRRARSDGALLFAAWALLLCAVGLIAATFSLGDAVSLGGLRRAILTAAPADRIVSVRLTSSPSDAERIGASILPELAPTLEPAGGEVAAIARAGGLVITASSSPASMAAGGGTALASFDRLASHGTLVAGRWPAAGARPVEAALSEGAAAALRLGIGDSLTVADSLDASRSVALTVVGILRPTPEDPYWAGSQLETTGVEERGQISTRGPLFVPASDLLAAGARDLELEWRLLPDVEAIRTDDIARLQAAIGSLPDRLGAVLPVTERPTVTTGLGTILGDLERSTLVTRTGVLLLALQFAILAGYAIVLVAGVLVARRSDEVRMLRSRGAGAWHVTLMALVEAILLAAAAAVGAPFLALGVVTAIGSAGPLSGTVAPVAIDARMLVATVLAAAACVPALALPTLASVAAPDGLRPARTPTTTLPQRVGIDVVLLVLAVVALWQLGRYGAPLTRDARGALGIDPLLVGAPAIGLLAGAVFAVRAVPRLGELSERVLARRRGAVGALGGRQLGRRPLRYSRTSLLLVLAVASGTYALAEAATWVESQADQASYQAVGDVRVTDPAADPVPSAAQGSSFRGVSGVDSATAVVRGSISAGSLRDGQLLAVDPAAAIRLGGYGWDVAAPAGPADSLAGERATVAAVPLSPRVRRIGLVVDASLEDTATPPGDPTLRGISFGVVLLDGDGLLHRIDGGDAAIGGGRQRIEVAIGAGSAPGLAEPLRLEALELTVSVPPGFEPSGVVEVDSVEASDAPTGTAWTDIGATIGAASWSWTRWGTRGSALYEPPAGHPWRLAFPVAPPFSDLPGDLSGGEPAVFRLAARPGGPDAIAAIASSAFLSGTGAAVGDELTIDAAGSPLRIRVVATVDRLAPLDPASAFVVVDEPTLELRRYAAIDDVLPASEWWLSVASGAEPAVLADLRSPTHGGLDVVGREELTGTLRGDPVALGVIGALGLGALAAVVFAIVGFLVSATASTTERLREFALLEALGLSIRQLRAWLLLEHAFLLGIGLTGGVALGSILAWLVLPFATLTPTGAPPVPPPAVVIPWQAALPLLAGAALLAGVALGAASREVRSRTTGELLRGWGE